MKNTNKEFDTDISDKKTKTPLISTTPNIYQILKRFFQTITICKTNDGESSKRYISIL